MRFVKRGQCAPRILGFILSVFLCLSLACPLPVYAATEATINATSLVLNGNIGVNFYINTDNLGSGDTYVTINGQKQYVKNATKTKEGTLFTYYANAKEMHDAITVTVHLANGTKAILKNSAGNTYSNNTMTYSVADYISSVQGSPASSDNLKNLVRNMKTYGEYSQVYFGYNSSGLKPTLQNINYAEQLKAYEKFTSGELPDGVNYLGSSLILNSAVGIRHYFAVSGSVPKFEVNGNAVTPKKASNSYYVDIENVPASKLGMPYTLSVAGKWTLKYSALSYANQAISGSNAGLTNLCKAMYSYHVSAKTYFDQLEQGGENEPSEGYPSLDNEETDLIDPMFKVPYISTYYFNPKPYTDEDVIIPVYVTDYEQSEYLKDDTTKCLDIIVEIDGVVTNTVSDVPLGDYTLNLGKLSEGTHIIALQSYDKNTGLKSHKLYNDFLAVDRATYDNVEIYEVTDEDLLNYGISKYDSTDATDLINTRDGLTKLFADLQSQGKGGCILPQGTYRVEGHDGRAKAINIPSHFTVDMNGSTFKLNPLFEETSSALIRMDNSIDACLKNGILEGDRFERKDKGLEEYDGKTVKGECINTVMLTGGKYCTLTDLTIKNTTGHTVYSADRDKNIAFSALQTFAEVAIIDGQEVANEKCNTTDYVDLNFYLINCPDRYIYMGHFNGYRGIMGQSAVVYASFYDSSKKFLETVTGYQYRKMQIPANARYVRVTFAGNVDSGGDVNKMLNVYNKDFVEYFSIKNVDFVDTRTCAIATTATNNMLVEDVTYTRCGNSITPSPVDFEDGWEEGQDLYYRKVSVLERAEQQTATVIDNAGFNHVYEELVGHDMLIHNRVGGVVIRNINDRSTCIKRGMGAKAWSGFSRIYDNRCGYINFSTSEREGLRNANTKVKNCEIFVPTDKDNIKLQSDVNRVIYDNCVFTSFWGESATLVNCTVQPTRYVNDNVHFYGCTFKRLDGSGEVVRFAFNPTAMVSLSDDIDRLFVDCEFPEKTLFANNNSFHSGVFRNCKFADLSMEPAHGDAECQILFENCDINSSAEMFIETKNIERSSRKYLNLIFKNCQITHTGNALIYFSSFCGDDSQILFDGCTISKSQGLGVTGNNLKGAGESVSTDIIFRNTTLTNPISCDNNLPTSLIRVRYE